MWLKLDENPNSVIQINGILYQCLILKCGSMKKYFYVQYSMCIQYVDELVCECMETISLCFSWDVQEA